MGGDYVQVPPQPAFTHQIDFYRTALHELGHWTGSKERLARDQSGRFGSAPYGREELCAELASAFLCAALGIVPTVRHADYLGSWLEVLRADSRAIFKAASQASKAADSFWPSFGERIHLGAGGVSAAPPLASEQTPIGEQTLVHGVAPITPRDRLPCAPTRRWSRARRSVPPIMACSTLMPATRSRCFDGGIPMLLLTQDQRARLIANGHSRGDHVPVVKSSIPLARQLGWFPNWTRTATYCSGFATLALVAPNWVRPAYPRLRRCRCRSASPLSATCVLKAVSR